MLKGNFTFNQLIDINVHVPDNGHSCLYGEDVIKSKLIYGVLMRPKIRPKHVPTLNKRHV